MRSERRNALFGVAALALLSGCVAIGAWLRGRRRPNTRFVRAPATPPHGTEAPNRFAERAAEAARNPLRRRVRFAGGVAIFVILAAVAVVAAWRTDRAREDTRLIAAALGGHPDRAVPIMLGNGCAGCHTIPGVPGANGNVGPRLDGRLADKIYIGGTLPNTPANLVRWIRDARSVDPHTAMPSTRISDQEARDVAAYLYALR